ncbi:hypothetical protein BDV95DRAFT_586677 [Massariosphaeria phaeospora]|uniref:NmrA-like domain-containing protein n=1 Tax=Massariosphaeria phaeospora TaxID=100035 RepID=A0A7C8M6T8_9PLEO|nr:hypothetical protein BDV95DRAFT_586677 [Massariosphaeria phaeospora]
MTSNHIINQPRNRKLLLYLSILIPVLLILNSYYNFFNMSDIKNVIIIGAGGNLGPSILNAFLESSSFNVTVLSREGSSSTFPSSVKVVRANYESVDSLKSAFQGQDAVLSFVGGAAIGDQQKLIDAAIAAGVKRFIPSEYGSNTIESRVRDIVPMFAGKLAAVDYLKSKEKEISWTSVITGPFFDWGIKVGFLNLDIATKTATLIDGGTTTFSATNLRQIGLALVKILETPAVAKDQYVFISSFQTTQKDIVDAAEKITGDKWTIKNVTSKELIYQGNEKLKKQDFSGIVELIKGAAFGDHGFGDLTPAGLWNEKLGLSKEDFEDSVKAALGGKI